jgi:hypothetical protein
VALQINIALPSGVTTSYHKVAAADVNFHERTARITVYSFIDQAAREAGLLPAQEAGYTMPENVFPFGNGGNTQADAYNALKLIDPRFADAVDV